MPPRKKKSKTDGASQHEINVLWVANNFTADGETLDVRPSDAPSPEAWALLQVYNEDQKSRQAFLDKFYRPLYVKDVTQKSDDQARIDDQRRFFNLFELLERERPQFLHENRKTRPASEASEPVVAELPADGIAVPAEVTGTPEQSASEFADADGYEYNAAIIEAAAAGSEAQVQA